MAGYAATPLVKKLGIKAGSVVYIYQPPDAYFDWLAPLPDDIVAKERILGAFDFIHLFVKNNNEFRKEFTRCRKSMKKDGMMWISWPKKSSGIATDLNENVIRDYGLSEGLVDVKVCAVDETWSGLKFVFRLKDR